MVALDSEDDAIQRGEPAPDFELKGADGDTHSLSEFEDYDAALIVFTCNHCPYAKAKFTELNGIAQEYDDVAVIGINSNDAEEYPDDSYDRMVELVEDGTIDYTAYLRDESQEVATEYGAVCTPDPYLFENTENGFTLAYHGRIDDALNPDDEPTEKEMRDIIDRLLDGEEITDEFKPSRGCSIKWA